MPHRHHVPSSTITSFIDPAKVDSILEPWVADPGDRAFVVRCLIGEGPAHHRGANYVLLVLLNELLNGRPHQPTEGSTAIAVPMSLPTHLDGKALPEFPLRFPSSPLERLAPRDSAAYRAMIDCLTDGPPQHALANAAMVCLLSQLLSEEKLG